MIIALLPIPMAPTVQDIQALYERARLGKKDLARLPFRVIHHAALVAAERGWERKLAPFKKALA